MKLRKAKMGVRHEDCWGSLSTLGHPDIVMEEKGPINVEKFHNGVRLCATWEVGFKDKNQFKDFLDSLRKYKMLKLVKVITLYDNKALIKTEWVNKDSSYDIMLKNNCLYTSSVTQRDGYEIYDILTDDRNVVSEIIDRLSKIGGAKLFEIRRLTPDNNPFKLTDKQLNALQAAVSNDFYTWPRKVSLDEVAAMVGMKRRTFQENLRKAESKVIPHFVGKLFEKGGG